MHFKPKTEKELLEMNLWTAGVYNFQIATATDEVSKSGNEMIKLGLNVYNSQGTCKVVYDYLLEAMPHKIRHLCEACGLLEKYEMGALYAQDLVDKTGQLELFIQKDKDGQYADKNAVKDYVVTKTDPATLANNNLDDEVPF